MKRRKLSLLPDESISTEWKRAPFTGTLRIASAHCDLHVSMWLFMLSPKLKLCHHWLTLMSLQTWMTLFCPYNKRQWAHFLNKKTKKKLNPCFFSKFRFGTTWQWVNDDTLQVKFFVNDPFENTNALKMVSSQKTMFNNYKNYFTYFILNCYTDRDSSECDQSTTSLVQYEHQDSMCLKSVR